MTEKEIYEKLNELQLYPEYVHVHSDLSVIEVGITWDDWKHEHRRLDYAMESNFSALPYKIVVNEKDSSDCFSATHYYVTEEEIENE